MVSDRLRNKVNLKTLTLGSWITLGHPAIAEIMASAGFDWLVVDLEHSVIDLEVAGDLIRTIDLCGAAPLVRLTSNDQNQIKRVMDAGAHGIIVPMVNTPEEALRAVAATRYAPVGSRGVGLARAQGYGANFQNYLKWQSEGPVIIVQIEHKDAVDELEAILKVPGIDGFIVGPYDLSCSMGIAGQFEQAEFVHTIKRIHEIGQQVGSLVGMHIVEPDLQQLEQMARDGYNFIAYSVDIRLLDIGARQGIARIKEIQG
jgi:2-keto-3-deoxy-L-rhamnonate aldolase RhmA